MGTFQNHYHQWNHHHNHLHYHNQLTHLTQTQFPQYPLPMNHIHIHPRGVHPGCLPQNNQKDGCSVNQAQRMRLSHPHQTQDPKSMTLSFLVATNTRKQDFCVQKHTEEYFSPSMSHCLV
uniref:Uncharacterized protein n=1 Tax=Lotus japonicus TaxID=34305 RepID=I3S1D5_LOTJA|nr:unknown [Lotus japonicus]